MVLVFMRFTLLAECAGIGIEAAEYPQNVLILHAKLSQLCAQRGGIGRFFRAIAAITATIVGWADGAAPGVRDGAQTWDTSCNHHTNGATQLALYTDAVRRCVRLALVQVGADDLQQLMFVNGAAAQLEVHKDVVRDWC